MFCLCISEHAGSYRVAECSHFTRRARARRWTGHAALFCFCRATKNGDDCFVRIAELWCSGRGEPEEGSWITLQVGCVDRVWWQQGMLMTPKRCADCVLFMLYSIRSSSKGRERYYSLCTPDSQGHWPVVGQECRRGQGSTNTKAASLGASANPWCFIPLSASGMGLRAVKVSVDGCRLWSVDGRSPDPQIHSELRASPPTLSLGNQLLEMTRRGQESCQRWSKGRGGGNGHLHVGSRGSSRHATEPLPRPLLLPLAFHT